jgi:ABC-type multidrug transport system fused ATPase/permease subunit
MFYVAVYALIGLGTVSVTVLSSIAQYTGALKASRKLFKQLLVGVVRATFRWHDVTPQGRMLNRFSKVSSSRMIVVWKHKLNDNDVGYRNS